MAKEIVSFPISKQTADELVEYYFNYRKENNGEYIVFQANYSAIVITIYRDKKNKYKAVFSGDSALKEAQKWNLEAEVKENKEIKAGWLCKDNQIGSDEVGVGDFLLPVVVVAAFVRGKDLKELESFGVKDSKKLTDEKIREIAPLLLKKFFVSKLCLPNEHYNELIEQGENLNSIKAKMHNRALLNMFKKFPDTKNIFVDQFVAESKYFAYLNDPKEQKIFNITFKTKGESYYPCVALASCIARYAFLLEKDALDKKYKMSFPCGASSRVNEFAKKFIKKYGLEEFKKIAKVHFANFKELMTELDLA